MEKVHVAVPAEPERSDTDAPAGGAAHLKDLVRHDLNRVNQVILERMQSQVPLIPQLAGHIVAAGGKRLRPVLTLASAHMCGYSGERHVNLAACVEFIHTATLLHDDVVDESEIRRGMDTANAVWGNKASVLVGDFLFSRAFQLMVADESLHVLRILSNASATISEGEVHQLLTANNTETDEHAYLQVIEAKTAALFSAACQVGAVVAGRTTDEEQAMARFGEGLGIAFQVVDDVLDYSAEQRALGKRIGDDFRDGKVTLPIVLAYARGDAAEQAFWRRCIEDMEQTDDDLEHAMTLLNRHGCLDDALARAEAYARQAREAMAIFPDGPTKRALLDTLDSSLVRSA